MLFCFYRKNPIIFGNRIFRGEGASHLVFGDLMIKGLCFCLFLASCQAPVGSMSDSGLRIANGTKVKPSAAYAGSLVALVDTSDGQSDPWVPYCSGVLIGPRLVVTAAHCLTESQVKVALGLGTRSDVTLIQGKSIKHPHFGAAYSEPFSFDLGLVLLSGAIPPSARPLPIAKEMDFRVGDHARAVGYGSVSQHVDDSTPQENRGTPYEVEMQIRDVFRKGDEDLRDDLSQWGLITAVAKDGQSGGCQGDSGGPLIVWRGEMPLVAGIVNGSLRGRQCDFEFSFTNLDFYRSWIEDRAGS
jgi:secreted trypsin-like serine protease